MESSPIIGILILNRDGKKWLPSAYTSIGTQQYRYLQTYLVDNASTDGSIELTLQDHPEVKVVRMPQNLGYSMAYNVAMPYAFGDGCDWIVWANNDIRIEPNCFSELALIAHNDPQIGVLGPAFLAWETDEPNYYMLGNHPNAIDAMISKRPEPIDVEWVEGSFLMVSRRCFEEVGPLDPCLNFYWEEADFCRRARYQGWRVVLAPTALARHYGGGSIEDKPENIQIMNWLQARNYYIYHLANPFQNFSRNMLDTVHLFGVKVKKHLNNRSLASIVFETRVLLFVLMNLRTVFLKWQRDRAGGKPPTTTPNLQDLRPEILRYHSHFEDGDSLSLGRLSANV